MHFSTFQPVLLAGASLIAGVASSPLLPSKHVPSGYALFTPSGWPSGLPPLPTGLPPLPTSLPTGVFPGGWGPHAPKPTGFGTGAHLKREPEKTKKSKTKKTKTHHAHGTGGFPYPTGGFPHPTGGFPHPTGGFPHPTGGLLPTDRFHKPTGVVARAADATPKSKTHKPKGTGGFSWPWFPLPTGGFPHPTGGFPHPTGGFPHPTGGFPKPTGGFPIPTGGFPTGGFKTHTKPSKSA